MYIQLSKWTGRPYVTIVGELDKTIFKVIDAVTSYKIKNFEHIDNTIYKCPKCGFWITVMKAKSDYCKRCNTLCETGTWDGMIRLLSKTRQGKWYFPIGLISNVETALNAIGVQIEVTNWPDRPGKENGGLGLTWTGPTMRTHQDEAIKKALSKLIKGRGVVLEMPTGSGKTMTAMKLMTELNTTTLILVHKKNLMEQWENVIRNVLEWEPALYGDNTKDIGPITIGMVQSIANAAAFPMNLFNFVITDECVDGETLIETDAGKMKIKDIVNKRLKVKVKTHTGKLKKIKRYHKIKTSKPMVRIVLENGILECTEDHKILTSGGWKKAKDLLPGKDMVYEYAKKEGDI